MSIVAILDQLIEIRDATGVQTIQFPARKSGQIACYDRLAAVDFSNALTILNFGFQLGPVRFWLEGYTNPVLGVCYSTHSRIFVDSAAIPIIQVAGGVAGDRIGFYAYGYLTDKPI
jgi:hypothetical protein